MRREILLPDPAINAYLRKLGGVNRYGDSNFRVVWGWSRMGWIGGKHEVDDTFPEGDPRRHKVFVGERLLPKYIPSDRFYVEAWYPPEFYAPDRETWDTLHSGVIDGIKVDAMGPYPERGDYEFLTRVQTADGGFSALTPTAVEAIVGLVRRNQAKRHAERKEQSMASVEQRLKDDSSHDDAILSDVKLRSAPQFAVPANYGGTA